MNKSSKILCPVDLSERSADAISLATTLARQHQSKIVFIYVAPQWMPEEAMLGGDYVDNVDDEDKQTLLGIRPDAADVEYEHLFVHGNAGPEIIKASGSCDMIVMSTHGHGGLMRMLMGSVAQYTMRNAECPVIVVRNPRAVAAHEPAKTRKNPYVTKVMRQVQPIHTFDNIETVTEELERARESGAPVVNVSGKCIGVLTRTDIEKYHDLKARYAAGDKSVVEEMFEVDEYGMFRSSNYDFDQVQRHMTAPAITISDRETCDKARQMFGDNRTIHHLVVVDDSSKPVGILEPKDVASFGVSNVNGPGTGDKTAEQEDQ